MRTPTQAGADENEPREKTLNLVYDALEIKIENPEILNLNTKIKINESTIINCFFLLVLNLVLISITGFLTLDSESNLNSRIGAIFLSFFIPFFIFYKTQKTSGINRMLKFGCGYMFYIVLGTFRIGMPNLFVSGLFPCLLISLATLYYGNCFLNNKSYET